MLPSPPTLAELAGDYAVAWSGLSGSFSAAASISDDAIRLSAYPCRPPGEPDEIGGVFEYDPQDGSLVVEVKSLDGATRLAIGGAFSGGRMSGSYSATVVGAECDRGRVVMEKTR